METKLFVGNLAYKTTEDDLRSLFSQAGTVKSVALIKDRDTGRSRGFAFVEMESQEEAQKAISLFNGTQFDERTLRVNFAQPKEEGTRGGYDQRRSGGRPSGGRQRNSGDSNRRY